ncbi:MAG: hypothetical protein NC818_02085 [Candidatus Omnitrophica bacterium]|nr:hypothetical protein [Candidatus Omnitrophota bacterium]
MVLTKEFKNSIIISLFMHIFIFFIFNIHLFPQRKELFRNVEVSFYGNLLEEYGNKGKKTKEATSLSLRDKLDSVFEKKTSIPWDNIVYQKDMRYIFPEKPYKEMVDKRKHSVFTANTQQGDKFTFFSLNNKTDSKLDSLPLIIKDILSSDLSYLVIPKGENMTFKLRFFISEKGLVEFVEPLFFSGNPELDIFVRKAVKEWVFLPPANKRGRWYEIDFCPRIMARRND